MAAFIGDFGKKTPRCSSSHPLSSANTGPRFLLAHDQLLLRAGPGQLPRIARFEENSALTGWRLPGEEAFAAMRKLTTQLQ